MKGDRKSGRDDRKDRRRQDGRSVVFTVDAVDDDDDLSDGGLVADLSNFTVTGTFMIPAYGAPAKVLVQCNCVCENGMAYGPYWKIFTVRPGVTQKWDVLCTPMCEEMLYLSAHLLSVPDGEPLCDPIGGIEVRSSHDSDGNADCEDELERLKDVIAALTAENLELKKGRSG